MSIVSYNQAGYIGCSLSEGASDAYSQGERPLSKWSKQDIIDEVVDLSDGRFIESELKKFTKQVLQDAFLSESSWHHTSRCANITDFYSVDELKLEEITLDSLITIAERSAQAETKIKKPTQIKKGKIVYEEWEGSRRYGKFVQHEGYCLVIDNWCYLEDGKKKDIFGTHVKPVAIYSRAPKGTATIFKKIKQTLPKKYR